MLTIVYNFSDVSFTVRNAICVINGWIIMQREAKVTYFKELSEHLHDWTGENHKKANVDIRPRTHYYRIRNIICNHM